MQHIHVVDGDSSEGSLRYAVQEYGVRGEVFNLRDILSIGPLDSGPHRQYFLRALLLPSAADIEPDADETIHTAFERWAALRARCQVPTRVILWTSSSGADHVLLRMACRFLQDTAAALWQVLVPPFADGSEAVAMHPPRALARFAGMAAPLSRGAVEQLAREYLEIATHPEPLREIDDQGILRYRAIDFHDGMLLDCCPTHWTRAARVVGDAMGRRDLRNRLPDIFFAARLDALVQTGRIEARGMLPVACWMRHVDIRRIA